MNSFSSHDPDSREYKFYVTYSPPFGGIEIYLVDKSEGRVAIGTNIVMQDITEERRISHPPTMRITREHATQLMNELWNAGIRPPQIADETHLSDLRDEIKFDRAVIEKLLSGGG